MADLAPPLRSDDGDTAERRQHGESMFSWFNRSSRPACVQGRRAINAWLQAAPTKFAQRLRHHIVSKDDRRLLDALFELYLYTLFKRLGFEVTPEPQTSGRSRPDFLLSRDNTPVCYLEATVDHGPQDVRDREDRTRRVLEQVAPHVTIVGESLWVHDVRQGRSWPSGRRFAGRINDWLSGSLVQQVDESGHAREWVEDQASGWAFLLSRRPLKDPQRRLANPFGIVSGPTFWLRQMSLRNEVRRKLDQHRDPSLPIVVAVSFSNPITQPEEDDVVTALQGRLFVNFPIDGHGAPTTRRLEDGLWTSPGRSAATRCPCVLTCMHCLPWALPEVNPVLWAQASCACAALQSHWPLGLRYWADDGTLIRRDQASAATTLGLI
ncbi:MAG: hypothetical protein JNK35_00500 [Phycisphaerae bacterium]|nr:hypothetical protein [Phycisphaerae bacterium]